MLINFFVIKRGHERKRAIKMHKGNIYSSMNRLYEPFRINNNRQVTPGERYWHNIMLFIRFAKETNAVQANIFTGIYLQFANYDFLFTKLRGRPISVRFRFACNAFRSKYMNSQSQIKRQHRCTPGVGMQICSRCACA